MPITNPTVAFPVLGCIFALAVLVVQFFIGKNDQGPTLMPEFVRRLWGLQPFFSVSSLLFWILSKTKVRGEAQGVLYTMALCLVPYSIQCGDFDFQLLQFVFTRSRPLDFFGGQGKVVLCKQLVNARGDIGALDDDS
ncbi:Uu.00g134100.m01.CDS01 [Anthostomella pinea]|uniref:Uu.00g134100.m01.CDS01 n=1 Tax=Anthostomella pinea TaxID=933095 RepID=A0AAI8YID5_9PEZI|nr:Uu.00g134100.m01.CDS01 [Anthostomella pinea]